MRKGCWQIDARIDDMDINGVYASVCFPSRVAGFGGARFAELKDQALGLACVRAWNDWHIEAWAGPYPDRLWFYRGISPYDPGRRVGHEFIGVVETSALRCPACVAETGSWRAW